DHAADEHGELAGRDQADERAGLEERQPADERVGPLAERVRQMLDDLLEAREMPEGAGRIRAQKNCSDEAEHYPLAIEAAPSPGDDDHDRGGHDRRGDL